MKNIFIILVIFFFSLSSTFAGSDTQTNFDGAKTDIVNIQNPDLGLPNGVPNQKGKVGNILSRLFGNDGKINNFFLRVLGNRSDGSVLRWSGGNGGQLIEGSIYDDGTNVGIGTNNPVSKLQIGEDIYFSTGGTDVFFSSNAFLTSGNDFFLNIDQNNNSNSNAFIVGKDRMDGAGGTELFRIVENGRVGIGTINPQEKLHVAGQGQVDIMIQDTDSSGAEAVTAVEFHDSAGVRKGYVGDGAPTQEDIYLTSDSGSVRLRNGDEDNLIVTPGGNVGVRTPSPIVDLHVFDNSGSSHVLLETMDDAAYLVLKDGNAASGSQSYGIKSQDGRFTLNLANDTGTASELRILTADSTGKIGIGTSAPSAPLDIGGTMFLGKGGGNVVSGPDISFDASGFFSSDASLYFMLDQDNNSTDQFFRVLANDDKIGGGAVELFQINESGHVGIGTSSPQQDLDVAGTEGGFVRLDGSDGTVQLRNNGTSNTWKINASGTSGETKFYIHDDSDVRLAIDQSGGIGIGTGSPKGKLHIAVGSDVSHTSTNVPLLIGKESGENIAIDSNEIMARNNGNPRTLGLNWEGGGVDLNSNAGGKFQVGTQAISGNYGTVLASGSGKGGWDGYSIENAAVFMYKGSAMGLYNDIDNEWVYYALRNGTSQMYYNGGWKIKTESNGARINGSIIASAFTTSSDKRLKENFSKYTGGEDVLSKISVKRYDWKDETRGSDIGVIAQEVREVFPEAVHEGDDGYLSVDYPKLVLPVIEVVQKIQKTLQSINSKLDMLEKENQKISDRMAKIEKILDK